MNIDIQRRSIFGTIEHFDNVTDFLTQCFNFEDQIEETTKFSFTDSCGIRRRFTMRFSGGVFDEFLFKKCGKFFPVGTFLFVDVPLCFDEKSNQKINKICNNYGIDDYDAYDCLHVRNAFTHEGFIEYLFEEEKKIFETNFCQCSCCNSIVCVVCEPLDLSSNVHVAPCGRECYCYGCTCKK